ncbi:MAG: PEGA domain-containing protein [Deltaproteobacteria bacterium]|nr:PEGA domain-containing protein [Deltaproteobacteria bacterium]
MGIYFLVLVSVFVFSVGQADDLPDWLSKPPPPDGIFLYFTGSSDDCRTLEDARESAYQAAVADAVRDQFGIVTQIESDHYATDTRSQAIKRLRESSDKINIRGFERVDTYVEKGEFGFRVSALYRYPKTEMNREKARLQTAAPTNTAVANKIEGAAFQTQLNLSSEPSGATVWINDLPLGQTPLEIKGLLRPGPIKIRFDQPQFEVETREAIIVSAEPRAVHALLRPSHSQLLLEEVPEKSRILINRREQPSVQRKFELIAGQSYRLEIQNEDFLPMIIEDLKLDRNEIKTISARLIPKPARLSIATAPAAAVLRVNGNIVGSTPYSATLEPGDYKFDLEADGFEPEQISISLSANKPLNRVVMLRRMSEGAKVLQGSTTPTDGNPFFLNAGIEAAGSQFTQIQAPMGRFTLFGKSIGRSWFGYGMGISVGTGEAPVGKNDLVVSEDIGVRLNVNHEFSIGAAKIELGIEPGFHAGEIQVKDHGTSRLLSKAPWNQFSTGAYVAWNIYTKNNGVVQLQLGSRAYSDGPSFQGQTLKGRTSTFIGVSWGGMF